jgi:soluble lytic murein transglycosylase
MKKWLKRSIWIGGVAVFLLAVYLTIPGIVADNTYPLEYKDLIKKYALKYDVNPNLVAATIWQESHFNPDALSPAGATGMMQIMPGTAQGIANELGEGDTFTYDKLFNPDTSIRYGTYYLAGNVHKYNSETLALVAYNGGYLLADNMSVTGAYDTLNFETGNYYKRVLEVKGVYDQLYGRWWDTTPPKPKKPTLPTIITFVKNMLGL